MEIARAKGVVLNKKEEYNRCLLPSLMIDPEWERPKLPGDTPDVPAEGTLLHNLQVAKKKRREVNDDSKMETPQHPQKRSRLARARRGHPVLPVPSSVEASPPVPTAPHDGPVESVEEPEPVEPGVTLSMVGQVDTCNHQTDQVEDHRGVEQPQDGDHGEHLQPQEVPGTQASGCIQVEVQQLPEVKFKEEPQPPPGTESQHEVTQSDSPSMKDTEGVTHQVGKTILS